MDEKIPNERPAGPPSDADGSMTRWIIALFAVALFMLGGYKGYQWWVDETARTAAAAAAAQEELTTTPTPVSAETAPDPNARLVSPASPPPVENAPLRAPAVAGDNIINKCVVNDQVTFTNEPCPEGTTASVVDATAVDTNGVSGFTGDKAPAVVGRPAGSDDPSQQLAECHYLSAEIARMDYEFQQQLPPPVLDQIATRLKRARDQSASLKCVGTPKEATAAKPGSKSKVLEEKGD